MSNKYTEFHSHTPTLDTNAYADGDLMANPEEVARVFPDGSSWVTITDLVVVDSDDQGEAFDVYLTTASGSWGTLNAAIDVTDALSASIVGEISVAAGDYADFVKNQVAFKHGLSVSIPHTSGGTSIYVALVSRGTGTYTASGLTLKFGIEKG